MKNSVDQANLLHVFSAFVTAALKLRLVSAC